MTRKKADRAEIAAHLRRMAERQRDLAREFEEQADRFDPRPAADQGHTFRIAVELRSSSKVVGDEHHHDTEAFDPLPDAVEVRAWNLREALRRAAELPLKDWFPDDE